MVKARQARGSRALVGTALAAVLLLAACGGSSSSSKANDTTAPTGSGNDTTTTAAASSGGGGTGKCYVTPGKQKARVRFVNLFTNPTYKSEDIEVWSGTGPLDGCGKKLATVPFGTASDYVDVTASDEDGNWNTTAYVGGKIDDDHEIITQGETWKGGEQVTISFQGAEINDTSGLPPSAGGDQTFFELPDTGDVSSFKPVPGKALLGISAVGVQYVDKDGAWVAGLDGQTTCLKGLDDTESSHTNIGGTSLVQYPVDPGSVKLSLYSNVPGTCPGTSAIGPAPIDATAGSRTLVFVYGVDKADLKLLVLPVDS